MVTWPKFKWWLHWGSWTAMPCNEAEARVAKAEKPFPSLGSPWRQSESVRSTTDIEALWCYGALSVALCLRRFPSTPCHCSFWFKGSFSQTSAGDGGWRILWKSRALFLPGSTLWIISYATWFISCWRIFSFCSFVHTHMHASHTPCPDHLTRCHDKAGGSGAQLGAQGIET